MKLKENWRGLLPHKSKLSCDLIGKELKVRNEKFRKMSTSQKNIEVALDCLTMLNMGNIVSQYRREAKYWSESLRDKLDISSISKKEMDSRQEEALCATQCDVCQIGAVMLSKVRLGRQIKTQCACNIESGRNMRDRDGLGGIENSYENRTDLPYTRRTPQRMANNFLNVIYNNGEYDANDETDYLKDLLK
jgi:hypothetical protein